MKSIKNTGKFGNVPETIRLISVPGENLRCVFYSVLVNAGIASTRHDFLANLVRRRSAVWLRANYPQQTRLIEEVEENGYVDTEMLHYLAEMFRFRVKVLTIRRVQRGEYTIEGWEGGEEFNIDLPADDTLYAFVDEEAEHLTYGVRRRQLAEETELVKLKKQDTDQVTEENIEELLADTRSATERSKVLLTIEEAEAEPIQTGDWYYRAVEQQGKKVNEIKLRLAEGHYIRQRVNNKRLLPIESLDEEIQRVEISPSVCKRLENIKLEDTLCPHCFGKLSHRCVYGAGGKMVSTDYDPLTLEMRARGVTDQRLFKVADLAFDIRKPIAAKYAEEDYIRVLVTMAKASIIQFGGAHIKLEEYRAFFRNLWRTASPKQRQRYVTQRCHDPIYLLTKPIEDTSKSKHIKLGGLPGSPRSARTAQNIFSPVPRNFYDSAHLTNLKEQKQVSVSHVSSTEDEKITLDKNVPVFTFQQQQVEGDAGAWRTKPEVKASESMAYSSRSPYSGSCYDDSGTRGLGLKFSGTGAETALREDRATVVEGSKNLKEGLHNPTHNYEGSRLVPIAPDNLGSSMRMRPHDDTKVSSKNEIITKIEERGSYSEKNFDKNINVIDVYSQKIEGEAKVKQEPPECCNLNCRDGEPLMKGGTLSLENLNYLSTGLLKEGQLGGERVLSRASISLPNIEPRLVLTAVDHKSVRSWERRQRDHHFMVRGNSYHPKEYLRPAVNDHFKRLYENVDFGLQIQGMRWDSLSHTLPAEEFIALIVRLSAKQWQIVAKIDMAALRLSIDAEGNFDFPGHSILMREAFGTAYEEEEKVQVYFQSLKEQLPPTVVAYIEGKYRDSAGARGGKDCFESLVDIILQVSTINHHLRHLSVPQDARGGARLGPKPVGYGQNQGFASNQPLQANEKNQQAWRSTNSSAFQKSKVPARNQENKQRIPTYERRQQYQASTAKETDGKAGEDKSKSTTNKDQLSTPASFDLICYSCNLPGHLSRDCKTKRTPNFYCKGIKEEIVEDDSGHWVAQVEGLDANELMNILRGEIGQKVANVSGEHNKIPPSPYFLRSTTKTKLPDASATKGGHLKTQAADVIHSSVGEESRFMNSNTKKEMEQLLAQAFFAGSSGISASIMSEELSKKIIAVVDTGSNINFISGRLVLELLALGYKLTFKRVRYVVSTADNREVTCDLATEVRIKLHLDELGMRDKEFVIPVVIMQDAPSTPTASGQPVDVIIGLESLAMNNLGKTVYQLIQHTRKCMLEEEKASASKSKVLYANAIRQDESLMVIPTPTIHSTKEQLKAEEPIEQAMSLEQVIQQGRCDLLVSAMQEDQNTERPIGLQKALLWAVKYSQLDIGRLLIDQGANVNGEADDMHSLVSFAVDNSNLDILRLLLESGASATTRNGPNDMGLLHQAAAKGKVEMSNLLMDYGAKANVTDANGRCALHVAAQTNHGEGAGQQRLFERMVNSVPTAVIYDAEGRTPLHYIAQQGTVWMVCELLHSGMFFLEEDKNGYSALSFAEHGGSTEVIKFLLALLMRRRPILATLKTPTGERTEVIGMLPEQRHQVMPTEEFISNCIRMARDVAVDPITTIYHQEVESRLVKEYPCEEGEVNFDVKAAAYERQWELCPKWLTTYARNNDGQLQEVDLKQANVSYVWAIFGRHAEMGQRDGLIGPQPRLQGHDHVSQFLDWDQPLTITVFDLRGNAEAGLNERTAWLDDLCMRLVRNINDGDMEEVESILHEEHEAIVNHRLIHLGTTPLIAAIEKDDFQMVVLLFTNGACVEVGDKDGRTPIFHAIKRGNWEILSFLLDIGVNVDHQDSTGSTPLHVAAAIEGGTRETLDCLMALLSREPNLSKTNGNNMTPVQVAMRRRNTLFLTALQYLGVDDADVVWALASEEEVNHQQRTDEDIARYRAAVKEVERNPINFELQLIKPEELLPDIVEDEATDGLLDEAGDEWSIPSLLSDKDTDDDGTEDDEVPDLISHHDDDELSVPDLLSDSDSDEETESIHRKGFRLRGGGLLKSFNWYNDDSDDEEIGGAEVTTIQAIAELKQQKADTVVEGEVEAAANELERRCARPATCRMVITAEEGLGKEAVSLLNEYSDVFQTSLPSQAAMLKPFEIQLIPGSTLKRHKTVRPQGQFVQQEIAKEVRKLIDTNCVIPAEAEACSQVLLVRKTDDSWRFCIDYRELNKVTIPDSFPLPRIEEVLQHLEGKALYTVFDLLKGYYQLSLHENSRKYSAFITAEGVYQWVRIPMGVMNAPSYFQQQIRTVVLAGLEAICSVYIDDVIIFGTTEEDHWRNVRTVLNRFKRFGITVSPKKCQWGLKELQYLGIIVSKEGQRMSEVRKQAFKDIPLPSTMTQLRSFLGVGNYFRKHIKDYARLTKPLNGIVNKGKKTRVVWSPELVNVFESVKLAIINAPMLHFLKQEGEICLYTDASDVACGAHLTQKVDGEEQTVAFLSQTFNQSQAKWATGEKEMFAIVYAIKKLHFYLANRPFVVKTDHRNLQYETHLSQRVQRWRMALADYTFTTEYIKGETNVVADALSRCVLAETQEQTSMSFASYVSPASTQEVHDIREAEQVMRTRALMARASQRSQGQEVTEELSQDIQVDENMNGDDEVSVDDISEDDIEEVISQPKSMAFLISQFHDGIAGHATLPIVLDMLRKAGYMWPRMAKDVEEYILSCQHCQTHKDKHVLPHGASYHISSTAPMEEVAMDSVGPLPPDKNGYTYVLVMTDTFSRWTDLFPLKSVTAEETAPALLDFCTRYGTPERVTSDNGPQFVNEVIQELQGLMHLRAITTVAGNHRENGIVENKIRQVRRLLTSFQEEPICYSTACMMVRRVLNSRKHRVLGMAPADLQFGVAHRLDNHLFPTETGEGGHSWSTQYWKIINEQEKAIATTRGELSKQHADKVKQVDPIHAFKPGDWVLVESEGSIKTGRRKREGPFRVTSVTPTTIMYQSPKFPSRKLAVAIGRVSIYHVRPGSNPHADSLKDDSKYYVVEKILAHRIVGGKKSQLQGYRLKNTQVCVKWVGHDKPSWEPVSNRTIRRLDTFKQYALLHPELEHLVIKKH